MLKSIYNQHSHTHTHTHTCLQQQQKYSQSKFKINKNLFSESPGTLSEPQNNGTFLPHLVYTLSFSHSHGFSWNATFEDWTCSVEDVGKINEFKLFVFHSLFFFSSQIKWKTNWALEN